MRLHLRNSVQALWELNLLLLDVNQNIHSLKNYVQQPCNGAKSPNKRSFTEEELLRNGENTTRPS